MGLFGAVITPSTPDRRWTPIHPRPGPEVPAAVSPRRCAGTRADGTPCQAPENLVDPDTGLCPSHSPGAPERLSEAGRKGAEATRRKHFTPSALDPDDLPPLRDHDSAKLWLERIGRAVATGTLSDRSATAAIRAVSEWLKAHEGALVAEDVQALRDRLEALESELGGSLAVVK